MVFIEVSSDVMENYNYNSSHNCLLLESSWWGWADSVPEVVYNGLKEHYLTQLIKGTFDGVD